jgi:hypothetical protein
MEAQAQAIQGMEQARVLGEELHIKDALLHAKNALLEAKDKEISFLMQSQSKDSEIRLLQADVTRLSAKHASAGAACPRSYLGEGTNAVAEDSIISLKVSDIEGTKAAAEDSIISLKVLDIVAGLPVAPWVFLMQYVIPFAENIFVAGSTGTWLAEFGLHRLQPNWKPSDIDVFMIRTNPLEFEAHVDAVKVEFATWSSDAWPVRTNVIRKHHNMINIQWWISGQVCPTLSFINCIKGAECAEDITNGFDIDICKVTVNVEAGEMIVRMSTEVRRHIQEHVMNCSFNQDSRLFEKLYPMLERTIDRVEKYSDRGYRLQKLIVHSVQSGRLKLSQNRNCELGCGFEATK